MTYPSVKFLACHLSSRFKTFPFSPDFKDAEVRLKQWPVYKEASGSFKNSAILWGSLPKEFLPTGCVEQFLFLYCTKNREWGVLNFRNAMYFLHNFTKSTEFSAEFVTMKRLSISVWLFFMLNRIDEPKSVTSSTNRFTSSCPLQAPAMPKIRATYNIIFINVVHTFFLNRAWLSTGIQKIMYTRISNKNT